MAVRGPRWKSLAERMFDGAFSVDGERRITSWNPAAHQLAGWSAEELLGRPYPDELLVRIPANGPGSEPDEDPLVATLRDGRPRDAEAWLRHRQGHLLPVRVRTLAVPAAHGRIAGAFELLSDNTPRIVIQRQTEELEEQSFLDPLTGIGNRAAAEQALERRLDELRLHDVPLAVVLADLDLLTRINDRGGRETGDRVLRMVARTLHHGVRSGTDAVYRWGGEEFVVLVHLTGGDPLRGFCEKLRQLVERSGFDGPDGRVTVTVSIGATRAAPDDTPELLVRRAGAWMVRSKEAGRNRATCEPEPPALPVAEEC
ncbi:MAG: GGDEF domain-containing protein [Deltaproteobacteria bacterium]|nr:GGDEF domain-containing protein [Deltaproteobacteria bacterium]